MNGNKTAKTRRGMSINWHTSRLAAKLPLCVCKMFMFWGEGGGGEADVARGQLRASPARHKHRVEI